MLGVDGASTVGWRLSASEVRRRCQGVLALEAGDVSGRRLAGEFRDGDGNAEGFVASVPVVRGLESWVSILDLSRLVDEGVKNSVSRVGDAEEDERRRV